MKALITTMGKGIMIFDLTSEEREVKFEDLNILGAYPYEHGYVIGERNGRVHVLNSDFEMERVLIEAPDTAIDLHDLVVYEGLLYVVATATNTINVHDAQTGELQKTIQLFQNTTDDLHHINSLAIKDGKGYLSMFLRDTDALDISKIEVPQEMVELNIPQDVIDRTLRFRQPAGAIMRFDLETGTIEAIEYSEMSQPHSLNFGGDDLYCTESLSKRVLRNGEELYQSDTYLRGLALTEDRILIGRNANRQRKWDADFREMCAGLITIDRVTGEKLDEINLHGFTEIYDIVIGG